MFDFIEVVVPEEENFSSSGRNYMSTFSRLLRNFRLRYLGLELLRDVLLVFPRK